MGVDLNYYSRGKSDQIIFKSDRFRSLLAFKWQHILRTNHIKTTHYKVGESIKCTYVPIPTDIIGRF